MISFIINLWTYKVSLTNHKLSKLSFILSNKPYAVLQYILNKRVPFILIKSIFYKVMNLYSLSVVLFKFFCKFINTSRLKPSGTSTAISTSDFSL